MEKESSDSESESRSGAVNGSRHNPEEKDLRKTNPHSPPVQSMEETRSQNGSEHSSSEDSHSEARHRKSPYREMSPQARHHPQLSLSSSHKSKSTSPDSDSQGPKLSPKLTSPDPKTRYLMNIKQEKMSPPLTSVTPRKVTPPSSPRTQSVSPKIRVPISPHSPKLQSLPLLYNHPAMLAAFPFAGGLPLGLLPPVSLQMSPPAPVSPVEKPGRKYCKHCDINFTYLNSFLTHKKYYCSARNNGDRTESPTATV